MSVPANNANAYLRTKVLTASPEELRLMLLDGAIRFARQGRDGVEAKNWEASYNGFSKCRNIIMELITSMRPEIDPDLCNRLMALYTFLYTRTMEASLEKNVVKANEVIGLLEYERETWVLLMEKLRTEAQTSSAGAAAPAAESAPAPIPEPVGAGPAVGAGIKGAASAAYKRVSLQG